MLSEIEIHFIPKGKIYFSHRANSRDYYVNFASLAFKEHIVLYRQSVDKISIINYNQIFIKNNVLYAC